MEKNSPRLQSLIDSYLKVLNRKGLKFSTPWLQKNANKDISSLENIPYVKPIIS